MRKAIAAILVVLLVVPLVYGTLSMFAVSTWILDRGFYLGLVSDDRLYEALLQEARRQERLVEAPAVLSRFDQVPADAMLKALREVLTPEYLRAQAVKIVNDAFDAVEGRSPYIQLAVDLGPLKTQLRGEDGQRFARALAAALPACSAGQEPVAPGATLYRCRPASMTVEQTAEVLYQRLPQFLATLPDLYPLEPEAVPLVYGPEEEFWFGLVGTGRLLWFSVILAVVAAGFWVGAAFVGGSNPRQIVLWLGWPLLPPALLALITGLTIRAASLWRWIPGEMRTAFGGEHWYSRELSEAFLSVFRTTVNTMSRGFLITGGITIGIAVGLIVWGSSLPAQREAA
jgi:hypothetical protein